MRLEMITLLGLLLSAACTDTPAEPMAADSSRPAQIDAGKPVGDAGTPHDAAADGCPAREPVSGTACSGQLRCALQRHGDCAAPSCPEGCTFLGIQPGAKVTSGVSYFALCQNGSWTSASEGDCSVNKAAARCDCLDLDAGSYF